MLFFQEILAKALARERVHVVFPNLKLSLTDLIERECYHALLEIKAIIENDGLEDFERIEKIVCVFEDFGSGNDSRDDFD